MIKKLNIPKEEITREALADYLAKVLFHEVRGLRKSSQPQEIQDKLDNALDGTSDGFIGVQLLHSYLMGTSYDLVTKPDGSREYVQKKPEDVLVIYHKTNQLIDYLNGLVSQTNENQPGSGE